MDKTTEANLSAILAWGVKFLLNPFIFMVIWDSIVVSKFPAPTFTFWETVFLFIMMDCIASLFKKVEGI